MPGTGALASGYVIRIAQRTILDRQAAAADAAGQAVAEQRQALDPVIKPPAPARPDRPPVFGGRNLISGQHSQRLFDLGKWDAELLSDLDDRYLPQHRAQIAPLIAVRPPRRDEPFGFIEVDRRHGDAAAFGNLANRQDLWKRAGFLG